MYNTAVFDKIGCPQRVVEHCLAVCRLALSISEKVRIEIDRDLIHDGAMYHDIGRCMTHGIEHAVIGARIASEMGLPEKSCKDYRKAHRRGYNRCSWRDWVFQKRTTSLRHLRKR